MDTDASPTMEVEVPPPAANPLGALPVELLFRIVRPLSTVEFCALRLSCRAVEQGLFHIFSHEFFTRKQFMMTEFSLQALIDIARHASLSKKLEHVSIGLEYMGRFRPRASDSPEQARAYYAAISDQSTIFSSGRAVEMLIEAFAHLPNLKTVSIRDHSSRTRFRDFNSGIKFWNSYGFPTFIRETNHMRDTNRMYEWDGFETDVFSAVSAALAKSGARPESIELLMRRTTTGVRDWGFWVPTRASDQEKYKGMLRGLRKLHLAIVVGYTPETGLHGIRQAPHLDADSPILDGQGLRADVNCIWYIAHTAPNLEWLRINFHLSKQGGADAFMAYFTNPRNSKSSEDRIVYPKLKQLDIGSAQVALASLCAMLEGLPTIEKLVLMEVMLVSKTAIPSPPEPGEMLWQAFLARLPTILPKLQRLEVHGAYEKTAGALHVVLVENNTHGFIIDVEDGETAMDECAKAADKLGYRQETPMNSEDNVDGDEHGVGSDGDGGDDGEDGEDSEDGEDDDDDDDDAMD